MRGKVTLAQLRQQIIDAWPREFLRLETAETEHNPYLASPHNLLAVTGSTGLALLSKSRHPSPRLSLMARSGEQEKQDISCSAGRLVTSYCICQTVRFLSKGRTSADRSRPPNFLICFPPRKKKPIVSPTPIGRVTAP
jgi:hypothetical protein